MLGGILRNGRKSLSERVEKTKVLFFHSHFQTGLCSLSYKLIRMDRVGTRDGVLVRSVSELVSKSLRAWKQRKD